MRIDVIYVRPLGDYRQFETRLLDVVQTFGADVHFASSHSGDLGRFERERVFVSTRLPNVVIVRDGEVVGQTIGDLPKRELELLVQRAIDCAHVVRTAA